MIISSIVDFFHCINENCSNTEIDFPSVKNNQVLLTDHYFSHRE